MSDSPKSGYFQLLHYGLMPRVVQDQSHKFETDELFRKLSEDTEV